MAPGHLCALSTLVAGAAAVLHAQPARLDAPDMKTVLSRAAAYVEEFRQQLSGVVAEEIYRQVEIPGERRELRSDLLLVRSATFPRWLQFRDTFEVDGQPVRDRADRLTTLFLHSPGSAAEQARRIASESTRYNVGELIRTINVPLMPLVILEPDVQARFRFSRASDRDRPSIADDSPVATHFRATTEVWVVRFEERTRPTIIRDPINRRDVPTQGRFWIEPHSGRVLMSEMRSNHFRVLADIAVSYQTEPILGMLVPIAMRETYTNKVSSRMRRPGQLWDRIEATAVYGKFRRFQVHVDERLHLEGLK